MDFLNIIIYQKCNSTWNRTWAFFSETLQSHKIDISYEPIVSFSAQYSTMKYSELWLKFHGIDFLSPWKQRIVHRAHWIHRRDTTSNRYESTFWWNLVWKPYSKVLHIQKKLRWPALSTSSFSLPLHVRLFQLNRQSDGFYDWNLRFWSYDWISKNNRKYYKIKRSTNTEE